MSVERAVAKLEPIQRRRLFEEVLSRLIERIGSGEFKPGDQLPSERELKEQYGVGRPAVREALQTLERDGIVAINHGERARVLLPTAASLIDQMAAATHHLLSVEPSSLEHLKDARLFLETGLAERAAQVATQNPNLAGLRASLVAHEQSLDNLEEFPVRDMEFHREIAVLTGNPIFPALIEAMFGWLKVYYVDLIRVRGAEQVTIDEHRRIFRAIQAGDGRLAASAMREHLTRANTLYRQFEDNNISATAASAAM